MSGDHTGNWDSTQSIILQSAAIPFENSGRPYGWNDMDMLETGESFPVLPHGQHFLETTRRLQGPVRKGKRPPSKHD